VHVTDVIVPPDPGPRFGGFGDPRRVEDRAECDLKEPRQERRTRLIGEGHRLLGWQGVPGGIRVVLDEVAGCLGVQPFTDVALGDARARGQLARRQGSRPGKRPVQPELVAHDHQRRVERGSHLADSAGYERHQLIRIKLPLLFDDRHPLPPRSLVLRSKWS
jgi:hypothetical protein